MKPSILVNVTLILAGLIALGVGIGVLFFPHGFHASAGIPLADDVNLLNEMRASGGMVLAAGLFVLLGAVRASMAVPAMAVACVLYLSYGLSRVVSVVLDGVPNSALLQIMALELFIGGLCAVLLRTSKSSD